MTENLIDVLIYIYENYMDSEESIPADQIILEEELIEAGFAESEVHKAFDWLDELAWQQENLVEFQGITPTEQSIRIFSEQEQHKIDLEIQSLLLKLEQAGILNPLSRELVIERCMAIETPELNVDDVQWVVLLVLLNQPGEELAFSLMEDIVYYEKPTYLN